MSNGSKDGNGTNGQQPNSLREIVRENKEALHKMASRLGDVNTLYHKFDELKTSLDKQTISLDKQTASNKELTTALNNLYGNSSTSLTKYQTGLNSLEQTVTKVCRDAEVKMVTTRADKKDFVDAFAKLTKEIEANNKSALIRQYVIIALVAILCLIFSYIAWNLNSRASSQSDDPSTISAPVPESVPDQPQETPTPAQPPSGKFKKKK